MVIRRDECQEIRVNLEEDQLQERLGKNNEGVRISFPRLIWIAASFDLKNDRRWQKCDLVRLY